MELKKMIVGGFYRNMNLKENQDLEYLGQSSGNLVYFRNVYTKLISGYQPDTLEYFIPLCTKVYTQEKDSDIKSRYFLGFVDPCIEEHIELSQMSASNLQTLESALQVLEDYILDELEDFKNARIYEFQGLKEIPVEIENIKIRVKK